MKARRYRPLDADEMGEKFRLFKLVIEEIEVETTAGNWLKFNSGENPRLRYRTSLSREELAAERARILKEYP